MKIILSIALGGMVGLLLFVLAFPTLGFGHGSYLVFELVGAPANLGFLLFVLAFPVSFFGAERLRFYFGVLFALWTSIRLGVFLSGVVGYPAAAAGRIRVDFELLLLLFIYVSSSGLVILKCLKRKLK